jgi:hypothetical protein
MSPAATTAKKHSEAPQTDGNEKSIELAEFEKLLSQSAKRTRELFSTAYSQAIMDEQARFAFFDVFLRSIIVLSTFYTETLFKANVSNLQQRSTMNMTLFENYQTY